MRLLLLSLLVVASVLRPAAAQELPKHEFRGAWIATVANLDWPSCRTCSASSQQVELVGILDKLQDVGINAVLFQVRTESDAFYDSPYEPSSYWLTGEQGADPGYDPLAFAIEESHKRGMELHAWLNPYRADRGSNYAKDSTHVTVQHPEWILDFGAIQITDPGLPAVRDYVTTIVADVARRYDIDGVHFDDYFYPYPPNQITNQDDASFAQYGGGLSRSDWRRSNIFQFVEQVRDSLAVVNPDAVFGISPFGIWKNGVPSGITGLDAYNTLYADAVSWLANDLIDYVTPQLYWKFGGGQDYGLLAPWWESVRNDRHLYPGHGLYRSDPNTFSNTLFAANEVPRQVRFNRVTEGIQGSVFFRAKNLTQFPSKGFADSLRTDLYRYPALPPPMDWRSQDAPRAPTDLALDDDPADGQPGEVELTWTAPAAGDTQARFFAVYRVPQAEAGDLDAALERAENLVGVTGETVLRDVLLDGGAYTYVVTSVSPNSIESAPSNAATVSGSVDAENGPALALRLDAPRPNPSAGPVTLAFTLPEAARVTLRVVDVLGREVAVLVDSDQAAGPHTATWRARTPGTYLVVLDADGARITRPAVVVR
ncbi:family 10 glycosylhydrolase [Rubrivirga sp.]|uniref:family 10 glycosylhydrolase n=1 Tax=Rubrivirga sp. TaxID=1885344 RepID=UPI003B516788